MKNSFRNIYGRGEIRRTTKHCGLKEIYTAICAEVYE